MATFEKILQVTEKESDRKRVEKSRKYILGHWDGIMQGLKFQGKQEMPVAAGAKEERIYMSSEIKSEPYLRKSLFN